MGGFGRLGWPCRWWRRWRRWWRWRFIERRRFGQVARWLLLVYVVIVSRGRDVRVQPRVVINVATAFIKGDYTVDQLLDGWQKQGATVGIREYYSVHPWDRDLPGKSHGADLKYLQTTIPHFHDKGARFVSAESSDNWGPNGLGYYLAARMLWDVREAKNVETLRATVSMSDWSWAS